ncbi:MAG: hypothetical protein GEV09_16825 [Pseudonocardiaceae bacterium]|nr:hypothetical protein [Pseudonocardiaceae bacterium]
MSTLRRVWPDVALAAATVVVVLLPPGHASWEYVTAAVAGALLVARRWWPRSVLLCCVPAAIGGLGMVPMGVAVHGLARQRRRLRELWPWLLLAHAAVLVPAVRAAWESGPLTLGEWLVTVLLMGIVVAGSAAIGALQTTRGELTERVAELDRAVADRDIAVTAQARAEERNRIAGDVHDIVGHYASLIAVQASGLEARTADPATAVTARRLRELSTSALDQMRTAVALWSSDAPLEPPVQDCWTSWVLVPAHEAQQAGVPVCTDVAEGMPRPGAPELRVLRRVVQEGIANAVQHGRGPVTVTLAAHGEGVRLQLGNDIPDAGDIAVEPAEPDGGPHGHGLAHLAERVAEVGGAVHAGRDGERWLLAATVPAGSDHLAGEAVAAAADRNPGSSA